MRSSRGKGKGIPQSLRAFSRVLCCTSAQGFFFLFMSTLFRCFTSNRIVNHAILSSKYIFLFSGWNAELTDLAVEAVQGDGRLARRPLVKRSLEIRAHEILLSLIDELIQKYNMSISVRKWLPVEFWLNSYFKLGF